MALIAGVDVSTATLVCGFVLLGGVLRKLHWGKCVVRRRLMVSLKFVVIVPSGLRSDEISLCGPFERAF